ncbi:hypothetical protein [Diaphorobacter aerolatus]|uniref:Uncharacterized protein n=1 Tax=Diaphorobacter aerolatus TaxID=1288495 RepID=A0A7H0GMI9_9BURK|nr:hypothetical protein [Diaphorobacter aerolatus]QNP49505.1 hypothetical protein H9K75_05755 [Diaphorobacter aerolatus]
MIYVKTQAGQLALKERHGALTPRQRSAFILFDGKRTMQQVLDATAPMGITPQDVQVMIDQGLLEATAATSAAPAPAAVAPGATTTATPTTFSPPSSFGIEVIRSISERYQDAYRVATELTSGLGLRGLPLTLAVESAGGYNELLALAPKIRAAVGDVKFARLDHALNG